MKKKSKAILRMKRKMKRRETFEYLKRRRMERMKKRMEYRFKRRGMKVSIE